MGGQQVVYKESAWAKVDYVDAKVRELSTKIDAEFNSVKESLKQMSAGSSEDVSARLIALEAKFNMLQEMFCKISSQTHTSQIAPEIETASKTATPKWLNARELLATLKDKNLETVSLAQLGSMLVWSNLITREMKAKNGSYRYALTKYGEELNIVRIVGDHNHIIQYNPKKVEDLAGFIDEYKDWYSGSRRA